jgi:exodeoxyribonuclease VII large subunit
MKKSSSEEVGFGPLFESVFVKEEEIFAELMEDFKEPAAPRIYSVSELSQELRDSLAENFPSVMVQAEVADFKGIHRSGHLYFGLKDEKAQIRAVMWRGAVQKVPFEIKGGLEVIVTGKIDYYGGSGSLQINVERMEPVGIGALQLKFEQLKAKLAAEGLFDVARKRPINLVNTRIGLVTGRSTAALQDMLKIFRHRFPLAEVFLFHAAVQGASAPSEIVSAIERANRYSAGAARPLDLILVARGGGSYEDLFCFNDESVARAIVASKIPIITGIGHEIDITIADMVADRRAATPTHAAGESVPDATLWLRRLEELAERFTLRMEQRLRDVRQKLDLLYNRLVIVSPQKKLEIQKERLGVLQKQMEQAVVHRFGNYQQRLQRIASVLDALSPLKVFERGFGLVTKSDGQIARSVGDLKRGDRVELRLKDGQLPAEIL